VQEAPRRLPNMRKRLQAVVVISLMAVAMASAAASVMAATAERYLHVRVEDSANGESVNVNVPLSMAEKILPAVNHGNLHQGKVTVSQSPTNGIDVRAILDAIRTAPDNEFVTVKEKDQDVRVAKSNGNIVVEVRGSGRENQKVNITVPMKVVDALFSTAKQDELDVAAALRALSDAGDALLITVQDATQHVRIWVDSRNTAE
jgi:hypothetical protein